MVAGLSGRLFAECFDEHQEPIQLSKKEKNMPTSVRKIMTTNLVRIPPGSSVLDAARLMRDSDVGNVIIEKDGRFCGILTDRDIVIRAVANGHDGDAAVESICSKDVATLTLDSTDEDAVRLMREKSVRRLPVLTNGKAVGIVSLGDLAIAKDPSSVLGEISAAAANH
jgi:CBS domain-containing protein